MRTVDVIIPTMRKVHAFNCIERLQFIPWPMRLHVVASGKTWGEAINIGLSQTEGIDDVILMDDDVFINSKTFQSFDTHYDQADIFGFRLLYPDGRIQHAGGISDGKSIGHIGNGEPNDSIVKDPYFVCHATTSLIYIKRHVLNELQGITKDFPGTQFDDVDFNFRALKKGFKILQLPNEAIHLESASKKGLPEFTEKMNIAYAELTKRHLQDESFKKLISSYPTPLLKLITA